MIKSTIKYIYWFFLFLKNKIEIASYNTLYIYSGFVFKAYCHVGTRTIKLNVNTTKDISLVKKLTSTKN